MGADGQGRRGQEEINISLAVYYDYFAMHGNYGHFHFSLRLSVNYITLTFIHFHAFHAIMPHGQTRAPNNEKNAFFFLLKVRSLLTENHTLPHNDYC